MKYTLKQPVSFGQQTLEWVLLRKPTAGDMLFARGDIANDKRMNASMVNDGMTISAYLALRVVVGSNFVGNLPPGWVFRLNMDDLTDLVDHIEAVGADFGTVEEYREHVKAEQARAEAERLAEASGQPFQQVPQQAGLGEVDAGTGNTAAPTGPSLQGGTGTGPEPFPG